MNIKDFEYIIEIANQESISKAAARLYLTQPALTKFLQKIESEFETPLFQRIGKKLRPTVAGESCIEKAKKILEINDQLNKDIKSLRQLDHGYIRIGISASRGEFFMSKILPSITKQYPHLSFVLLSDAKANLLKKLENNELDIIFVSNSSERKYLTYHNISSEEMVLVVPNHHELLKKAFQKPNFPYPYVPLNEWIVYPFIMADIHMNTGQYTRLLFNHYQQNPHIILEVGSLQLIYSAVRQNIGITIAPSMPLIEPEHAQLQYLSFEDDRNIQWYFTAITKHSSKVLNEIIDFVKKEYIHPS